MWTEKKTDDEVLRRINCKNRLLEILNRRKLKFIGHVMRSESLEKNLLTGTVIGNKRRSRPRTRLSDSIKDICGLTMVQVERKAQDRAEWRKMVQRFTVAEDGAEVHGHSIMSLHSGVFRGCSWVRLLFPIFLASTLQIVHPPPLQLRARSTPEPTVIDDVYADTAAQVIPPDGAMEFFQIHAGVS